LEAAVKYFLIGSFASAFVVFGLALLWGGTGTFDASAFAAATTAAGAEPLLALSGLALVLAGFAFKIALVPFHMYQPDVYEGAPTPVTAFFVVGPKTASFLVLFRLLLPYAQEGIRKEAVFAFLGVVAVATMIIANLAALRQRSVKRMLAYSSIAHAGYILVAVVSVDAASAFFYLANYLVLGIGAFGALIALGGRGEERTTLDDLAGAGIRSPWLGAIFAFVLISLAGFPPTGGFLAKFFVFAAAVREGHLTLAVIGVLTSLVSVYYYLRVIVQMYMRPAEREIEIDDQNPALYLALFLCLFALLQLGLFPGNVLALVRQAAASL
jgi:NADH-quinone oxidoreductase subunit N